MFPAPRQFAGELPLAAVQAETFYGCPRCGHRLREPVDAADELQILAHGQVLIQAEALRHVPDLQLDLVGLGADVVAEASAGPFIRRQQPAQHSDRGRLAGAVRAQEAIDRATLHLHRQVTNHRAAIEFFCQAVHIDDDVGLTHLEDPCGKVTVTGWLSRTEPNKANAKDVVLPDGKKLFAGSANTGAPEN